MSSQLGVVHRQFKVPLQVDGRIGHLAHVNIWTDARHVISKLSLKQQVPSGQEVIGNVVLRTPHGHSVTDAERAQNVQNFGIASVLFEQRDDYFDVLFLRTIILSERSIKQW